MKQWKFRDNNEKITKKINEFLEGRCRNHDVNFFVFVYKYKTAKLLKKNIVLFIHLFFCFIVFETVLCLMPDLNKIFYSDFFTLFLLKIFHISTFKKCCLATLQFHRSDKKFINLFQFSFTK
ncbi:hypothetical protein RFI_34177 [Reticulomyxa filosa]|uniref:Transmembrane protein n=1 Tax=Reticulomyxa filosa TaxID=46433 RepID=X6LNN6_RETFI|nr:hypothetical protein RFI_34177 [Reticulomyxa filosa]|eukprot:ETO03234.1 hypothetical protein RFI_34177 [Reticulomyxa filosa]